MLIGDLLLAKFMSFQNTSAAKSGYEIFYWMKQMLKSRGAGLGLGKPAEERLPLGFRRDDQGYTSAQVMVHRHKLDGDAEGNLWTLSEA